MSVSEVESDTASLLSRSPPHDSYGIYTEYSTTHTHTHPLLRWRWPERCSVRCELEKKCLSSAATAMEATGDCADTSPSLSPTTHPPHQSETHTHTHTIILIKPLHPQGVFSSSIHSPCTGIQSSLQYSYHCSVLGDRGPTSGSHSSPSSLAVPSSRGPEC